MADTGASSFSQPQASRPPRRWLRRIGIALGALVCFVVIGYFVLTSAAFLKGVILPKAGAALHARITISDATIHPFSEVSLRDLKVETTGAEPLVTAQEARARYSLWDIMRGQIVVTELALIKPIITIVQTTNGTSNLDPLTQSSSAAPKKTPEKAASPPAQSKSGTPPQINLQKIALQDATVRVIKQSPGGGGDQIEVSKVNVTLDNLKNGQTGKLTMSAEMSLDRQSPVPAEAGTLQAKLDGAFDVALGQDLSLGALKGGARLSVPKATGAFAQAEGFSVSLEDDLGADPAKQTAILRSLKLNGMRRETPLLLASLSSPFPISWGAGSSTVGDALLTVTLTNINLTEWKAFAPDLEPSGNIHATVTLSSQQSGKQLGLKLDARADGLGAKIGTNTLSGLDLKLSGDGKVADSKQIELTSRLSMERSSGLLITVDTTTKVDMSKASQDVTAHVEANVPRLLELMPQPGTTLSSGSAKVDTHVSGHDGSFAVNGTLDLSSLTGKLGEHAFTNLGTTATYDLNCSAARQLTLNRCRVALAATARAATNAVDLTGSVNLAQADALEGALKLNADTLDVTPYYDLFSGSSESSAPAAKTSPASPPASKKSAPPPSSTPATEPAPVHLPVKLLTFDTTVRQCYLREVLLSNVIASIKIANDQVTIKPVQLAINGGAVGAGVDLNLGVPGYQYTVAFNANRVPLEPLANSFSPTYRGQAKGDMFADVNIKGAGVTGPSLQKNLGGNLDLTLTNAEVHLVGPRAKTLLTPIALVLGLTDMLQSPLNWLGAHAKIADGKVNVNQFSVVTPAFIAGSQGEIPLAENINDSPIRDWPVDFSLRRSLAEKLNLAPKGGATNGDYALLPNFVKVGGTVGDPKSHTDKLALLRVGAQAISAIPGVDKSGILDKADSLLGGKLTGKTNSSADTNSPGTVNKLFDLLKKPKSK